MNFSRETFDNKGYGEQKEIPLNTCVDSAASCMIRDQCSTREINKKRI